jgi:inner membrane protein
VGKETRVALTSNWASPSFQGEFLPAARSVTKAGFSAEWKVLHLNRNYPQAWIGPNKELPASVFGVSFLTPVDDYAKTMRTAKYALLFIVLTFSCFFAIEILGGKTVHPIQYLLVGLALVTFYTLLLSLTEHVLFKYAYLIATVSVVGLVSAYARSVLATARLGATVAALLSGLYGYLYVLLQLEGYALLLGTTGLFTVLALFMVLTRRVDWFTVLKPRTQESGLGSALG